MVTRKEVAQLAGVSVAAVSRVVNNSGYVRSDKREAVENAIRELRYQPPRAAVPASHPQVGQIMFCTNGVDLNYAMEVYKGVSDYADRRGFVATLGMEINNELLKNMAVDGLILSNETAAIDFLRYVRNAPSMSVVCAGFGASVQIPRQIPMVEVDTYHAMEMALEYLISLGHTKIALATPYAIDSSNPRCVAYRNTMLPILGSQLDDYILLNTSDEGWNVNGVERFFNFGKQFAAKFIAKRMDATAVACFNDAVAIGMLRRFIEAGIRVPQDVSIIGLDAGIMGKMVYPSLTSVSLSPFMYGQECARVLLGLIAGEKVGRKINISVSLKEGQSVQSIK